MGKGGTKYKVGRFHSAIDYKMISIIEGRAKSNDMRKKSCIYVGLQKINNTVRNKYLKILSKGVPQKIDFIFGPANMGVLPLLS